MTNYTLEQLQAMSNQELDEAVALAQGFIPVNTVHQQINPYVWLDVSGDDDSHFSNYSPTANTTEGKAQARDLSTKYNLSVTDLEDSRYAVFRGLEGGKGKDVIHNSKLVAVVIASILAAQNEGEG